MDLRALAYIRHGIAGKEVCCRKQKCIYREYDKADYACGIFIFGGTGSDKPLWRRYFRGRE